MKVTSPATCHPFFGLKLVNDELLRQAYVKDIQSNSPAALLHSSLKSSRQKLWGAFLISINHHPVFTAQNAQNLLQTIQDEGVDTDIELTFAPERKLSIHDVRKAANDYRLFAPTTR